MRFNKHSSVTRARRRRLRSRRRSCDLRRAEPSEHRHVHHGRPRVRRHRQLRRAGREDAEHRSPRRAKASSSPTSTRITRTAHRRATGFITGRYQQRYGIESPLRIVDETRELRPSDTSLPRLLEERGLRDRPDRQMASRRSAAKSSPNRHGFDEFWGFLQGAVDYYSHDAVADAAASRPHPSHDLYHNEEPTTSTRLPDRRDHGACRSVHSAARDQDRSSSRSPTTPRIGRFSGRIWRKASAAGRTSIEDGTRADYVAMLERADQGIGAHPRPARSS